MRGMLESARKLVPGSHRTHSRRIKVARESVKNQRPDALQGAQEEEVEILLSNVSTAHLQVINLLPIIVLTSNNLKIFYQQSIPQNVRGNILRIFQ